MKFRSFNRILIAGILSALVLTGCTSGDKSASSASSAASGSSSASSSVSSSSAADVSTQPEQQPEPQKEPEQKPEVKPEPEKKPDPKPEPEQKPAPKPEPEKKPEPEQKPAPEEKPVPQPSGSYNFSKPAPKHEAVDLSYFDDAAFIGDSRTDGFMIYSGIGRGKNLTSNGLSIFKLGTKKALTINGKEMTLLEALAQQQYGKVYLSLGINELGYNNDNGFYQSYCDAIDQIRKLQPNAVIYIQGLIPVNEKRVAETSKRSYLENNHLRVYNDLMKKVAKEKQVVFLDLYSEFVDGNGALPYDSSKDGVHLNGKACKKWLGYLQTHTVDYSTLYKG